MSTDCATLPASPPPAASLAPFFQARSVAVVGASERPGSVGRALMENLHTFPGRVYPINPRRHFILDRRAYPDLASLPLRPDLAVIAVPAAAVPATLRQCAGAGVPAALVVSAGFRECGAEGAALERAALAEARQGGVRVIGPNCLGLMCPHIGLNASFAVAAPQPGHVAFLSQSGALCAAVLDWSRREQVGFSAFISVGSMADVGWGDLLEWLGDDPLTDSILLYMEAMDDAPRFIAAARQVAARKPILVLKAGRTAEAARAVRSHTGALAGHDAVFDAAFRRAGVMRVDSIATLFSLAELLAIAPPPAGSRLGIVTNAGGPGALAADAWVLAGGTLAPLGAATLAGLDRVLPAHWSRGNPVDVLGDADPERFGRAVEALVDEPAVDGVLAILTPQAMSDPTAAAGRLAGIAARARKPVLAAWMGGEAVVPARELLHRARVPVFAYPDFAAEAFRQLARVDELRREAAAAPAAPDLLLPPPRVTSQVRTVIQEARAAGDSLLSAHASLRILAAHGIPCVETIAAAGVEEAVEAASHVGYPVAVKLLSRTIAHKSDAGGVRLGLRDADDVRGAWTAIQAQVSTQLGAHHFLGVHVQPMVAGDGREFILGSSTDPAFGPVLLFGAGGRFTEFHGDHALDLPPLDLRLARRLAERTRIFATLSQTRGLEAVDPALVDELLVRFSRLVSTQEGIAEIDVNPLVVSAGRLLALDARIVLHPLPGVRPPPAPSP